MKKEEIIELNGIEYTLQLNRDSFLKIDQYCDIAKSFEIMSKDVIEHIELIEDGVDPFADVMSLEEMENKILEKQNALHKILERAFWIWLYPKHKLNLSEVQEILKPYFEDEIKFQNLCNKYGEYLALSIDIREKYIEQEKNLKALANK